MILSSATDILSEEGLQGLTIRKIAQKIGYSSGTLYQVFANIDDLIVATHILTFQALHRHLGRVEIGDDPEATLLALAKSYLQFATENENRWNAVFQHSLPVGQALPVEYVVEVDRLLGLGITAVSPVFPDGQKDKAILATRVLWAGLYGIVSLETASKLSRIEEVEEFITSLFRNYLIGLRSSEPD